jgi:hypothetical protein
MFFIPLTQIESVELVIHALRVAGGQADCTTCPAYRVCMKQCLTIADSVSRMVETGSLPTFDPEGEPDSEPIRTDKAPDNPPGKPSRGGLKVVK